MHWSKGPKREETLRKISESKKANYIQIYKNHWSRGPQREIIIQNLTGRTYPNQKRSPCSEETKRKIGEANRGKPSWRKGKPLSEEHKRRIGDANRGRQLSEETKLRAYTPERRKKLSDRWKGDRNPNRTEEAIRPYPSVFFEFRGKMLERDDHRCQHPRCGREDDLTVHHIDYDKENNHPRNLVTLCRHHNCKANFNRDYWTQFYHELSVT